MKRFSLILFALFLSAIVFGQGKNSINGAYLAKDGNTNYLWLLIDGYSSYTIYGPDNYLGTSGGSFNYDGKNINIKIEYNDTQADKIGSTKTMAFKVDKDKVVADGLTFNRLPAIKQDLDGLWRITGRKENEKINQIPRGDRKTIKILVDGYFQWIAINPAEKTFFGSGGGTYSFKNGKYVENILFFSRDNTRVGATLKFDGKVNNGVWEHSGLSSKGAPIFEIWTKENKLF